MCVYVYIQIVFLFIIFIYIYFLFFSSVFGVKCDLNFIFFIILYYHMLIMKLPHSALQQPCCLASAVGCPTAKILVCSGN